MVRVVCEYCQTVYNIPDMKLTKPVSQATCKVCQNKIVIRREATVDERETGGMSAVMVNNKGDLVREPAMTPTSTSAAPPPPEEFGVAETELSNSWREAIVDNRDTIQMLKKAGFQGPRDTSTAAGPKVSIGGMASLPEPGPTPEEMPDETENGPSLADSPRVNVKTNVGAQPSAMRTTPPAFSSDDRGASAPIAALAGIAAAIAAAGLAWSHSWAAGFSGLTAFAAASFASGAAIATALLRRRGIGGALGALVAGGLVALIATAAVLALHKGSTRALLESKPALAPLARFF